MFAAFGECPKSLSVHYVATFNRNSLIFKDLFFAEEALALDSTFPNMDLGRKPGSYAFHVVLQFK